MEESLTCFVTRSACICMCAYIFVYMCVFLYPSVCVYTSLNFVCLFVCMYIYMYVYVHLQFLPLDELLSQYVCMHACMAHIYKPKLLHTYAHTPTHIHYTSSNHAHTHTHIIDMLTYIYINIQYTSSNHESLTSFCPISSCSYVHTYISTYTHTHHRYVNIHIY